MWYALDTETTGFRWYDEDSLFAIVLTGKQQSICNRSLTAKELEELRVRAKDPRAFWFLQNAKFDMHFLAKENIFIEGMIFDTKTLSRIQNNQHISYSLDEISKREGVQNKIDISEALKETTVTRTCRRTGRVEKKPRFDMLPPEILKEYAEADGRATFDGGKSLLQKIEKSEVSNFPSQFDVLEQESKLGNNSYHQAEYLLAPF